MAFPSAPANGAIASFGGATYQYITATNTWKRTGFGLLATSVTKYRFVATANQTVFSTSTPYTNIDVYLNGNKLILTSDYTESSSTTITMTAPCAVGDDVELVVLTGV